ncbi:MAG TPA: zinc finger protein [Thermoanaerobaculia bacterium]|nr:zinc finger protein [Thermoanaerobaculia bacterium]
MAIREGAWDCPHCGRKGNRGPEKYCGGCGAPRGDGVKFYLPQDAPEITEAKALERAKAGPDWTCSFCEGDNPSTNAFCSSCGASREGAPARQVVEHRKDAAPPQPVAAPPPPPAPVNPKLKRGCQIGCLGLAALLVFFWFLGRPKETTLTVAGHRWERTVAVEELRTVQEEGWENELPAGARSLSSRREVHHHNRIRTGTETRTRTVTERVQTGSERVKVGERDLGNGYFEDIYEDRPVYEDREREETYEEPVYREEPVYAVRHTYEVEKWMPSREARAGAEDRNAVWPGSNLRAKEREGQRTEVYEVVFEDRDGAGRVYRPRDEVEWKGFEPGASYRVRVKRSGEIVEILGPA